MRCAAGEWALARGLAFPPPGSRKATKEVKKRCEKRKVKMGSQSASVQGPKRPCVLSWDRGWVRMDGLRARDVRSSGAPNDDVFWVRDKGCWSP